MRYIMFTLAAGLYTAVAAAAPEAPYQGQELREIKALSQAEVEGYLSGKGLGYAKAAELNHYPGPRHVLDMAGPLKLSREQTDQSAAIFQRMQEQAIPLGKKLVEKERELDRQFAQGSIDSVKLQALLTEIGGLQAQIRYVHLNAHLEQKALLTKEQIALYDQARGYTGGSHPMQHEGHKH